MHLALSPVQTDKYDCYRFAWRVYKNAPSGVPHLWPPHKAYLDCTAIFFTFGETEVPTQA